MIGRDPWLTRRDVRKARGRIDPASDTANRYLMARITNWGGSEPGVAVVRKGVDQAPPSRQLKDPFATYYIQGLALEPPLPLELLLNLTEESPLHAACLKAKADDACGRGWGFEEDGSDEPDQKLAALMEDITPDLTFTELLTALAWEMEGLGFACWEVVRGQDKKVAAIYPIPAHTVRATFDDKKFIQLRGGRIRHFKKFGADVQVDFETGKVQADLPEERRASEVIVFKSYTPRSIWYGLPKWVSAIATIAELSAIREFNISWFASGGQTDYHGHVRADSIDAAKSIVDQIKTEMQENAGRAHQTLFTSGTKDTEVNIQKMGELLREGHFRFRRADLAKEVLIAHNVPPYRIGWAETGALAGSPAEQMLDSYKTGAIEPIQTIIEDRLRQTLFNVKAGGIDTGETRFRLADLDKINAADVAAKVSTAIVTPNEARTELGLAESDDPAMNEHYMGGRRLGEEPAADTMKSADGAEKVIRDFERSLQDVLKEGAPPSVVIAEGAIQVKSEIRMPDPADTQKEVSYNDQGQIVSVTERRARQEKNGAA